MNLWIAKRVDNPSSRPLAASSDIKLREKILATNPDDGSEWSIQFGETKTDKDRVLELIEGSDPIQNVSSHATYIVSDGKVTKKRESGK